MTCSSCARTTLATSGACASRAACAGVMSAANPDSAWAAAEGAQVTVVLDAGPRELTGEAGGVTVVLAPRRGRDAADDEIARLVVGAPQARVVTSDAALAARARAAGAEVEGAGAFR